MCVCVWEEGEGEGARLHSEHEHAIMRINYAWEDRRGEREVKNRTGSMQEDYKWSSGAGI